MANGERINPWSSDQSTDYSRIVDQFGLSPVISSKLPNPGMLHRRGIVFAHRDLDIVVGCMNSSDPFGVLTGLMPSGRMDAKVFTRVTPITTTVGSRGKISKERS